jgi:hypothetical protein
MMVGGFPIARFMNEPAFSYFDLLFFGLALALGGALTTLGYSFVVEAAISSSIFCLWIVPSGFFFKRHWRVLEARKL